MSGNSTGSEVLEAAPPFNQNSPSFGYQKYFDSADLAAQWYWNSFSQAPVPFMQSGRVHVFTDQHRQAGLRYLKLESEHFGFGMARLEPIFLSNSNDLDAQSVAAAADFIKSIVETQGIRHVSAPVTSGDTLTQLALQRCGFVLADTIIGYVLELEKKPLPQISLPGIRVATADDLEQICQIAHTCFADRSLNINRFNSDLALLPPERVGNLYATFARNALINKDADLFLVHEEEQRITGFMNFRLPSQNHKKYGLNFGVALLAGVLPQHQRRGIYRNLLISGGKWLHEQGVHYMEVRTQLSNIPSWTAWQSLGSKALMEYHTFHRFV